MTEKKIAEAVVEYLELDDEEFVENLIKDIENYGREKKINGQKSLAKAVKKMMDTQQRYFHTRSTESLNESKKLEKDLRKTIEVILR